MKTMEKLKQLRDLNYHLLCGGDDGLSILEDSLATWGPADEPGFELPVHAKSLLRRRKLCVISTYNGFEYCSPTRALEWLKAWAKNR